MKFIKSNLASIIKKKNKSFNYDKKLFSTNRLIKILSKYQKKFYEDEIKILIDIHSTFIDENLIYNVLNSYSGTSVSLEFFGGVNGTIPKKIIINKGKISKKYYVPFQNITGINCTTDRPLRKKIFNSIQKEFQMIDSMSFQSFKKILKSKKIRDICLTYGESKKKLYKIKNCPYCSSSFCSKLSVGEGNSITGFLDASHKIYSYCNNCSLVYLNHQVAKYDLGIYYNKVSYGRDESKFKILKDWKKQNETNTSHFGNYLVGLKYIKPTNSVLDCGCGNGSFLSLVRDNKPNTKLYGVDFYITKSIIDALNQKNISASLDSFQNYFKTNELKKFDIITMWEVVEHLKIDSFKDLLKNIRNSLLPNGKLIFSTPDFFDNHAISLDFWAMAPGEHLHVFNFNFLKKFLNENNFQIINYERESVTTKLPERWYKYGATTNSTLSGKANADLIESVLKNDKIREEFKRKNRQNKLGSELIIIAKPNK